MGAIHAAVSHVRSPDGPRSRLPAIDFPLSRRPFRRGLSAQQSPRIHRASGDQRLSAACRSWVREPPLWAPESSTSSTRRCSHTAAVARSGRPLWRRAYAQASCRRQGAMSHLQASPLTLAESCDEHLRRVGLAAHDQGLHEAARVLLHMARSSSKIPSGRALRHDDSSAKTSYAGTARPGWCAQPCRDQGLCGCKCCAGYSTS